MNKEIKEQSVTTVYLPVPKHLELEHELMVKAGWIAAPRLGQWLKPIQQPSTPSVVLSPSGETLSIKQGGEWVMYHRTDAVTEVVENAIKLRYGSTPSTNNKDNSQSVEELAEKAAIEAGYPQSDKEQITATYWWLHNIFKKGYFAGLAATNNQLPQEEWETFCDIGYYGLHAVRPIGDGDFSSQLLFHVQSKEEAEALKDLLNSKAQPVAPTPTPSVEVEELTKEIEAVFSKVYSKHFTEFDDLRFDYWKQRPFPKDLLAAMLEFAAASPSKAIEPVSERLTPELLLSLGFRQGDDRVMNKHFYGTKHIAINPDNGVVSISKDCFDYSRASVNIEREIFYLHELNELHKWVVGEPLLNSKQGTETSPFKAPHREGFTERTEVSNPGTVDYGSTSE